MTKTFIVTLLILSSMSSSLFANAIAKQTKPEKSYVSQVLENNIAGSMLVGFSSGVIASGILLVKDATVGVVLKGGPEYWGNQRILPLTALTLFATAIGGFAGYYNEVNLLEALR